MTPPTDDSRPPIQVWMRTAIERPVRPALTPTEAMSAIHLAVLRGVGGDGPHQFVFTHEGLEFTVTVTSTLTL